MNKKSDKQKRKDATLHSIKKMLPNVCCICGRYGNDLMHLLPKSIWPEYYTEPLNLAIGCRTCHNEFDSSRSFRSMQTNLYKQVKAFDKLAADRYFGID